MTLDKKEYPNIPSLSEDPDEAELNSPFRDLDERDRRDSSVPFLIFMILLVISPLIFYVVKDCG